MPSIISHAAAGAALSIAFAPNGAPARLWPVAIAIAVLPDADSFLYYLRYYPTLGHRGFFHSLFLGMQLLDQAASIVVYCFAKEVTAMKLYLVQHGVAKSELEDPERPVTVRGEEETRKMSHAAKRLGVRPRTIYHSGKKRTEQTAGIMGAGLDMPVRMGQGLNQNDDIRPWVERISAEGEDLMIVGHLPFLERLSSFLVCGDERKKPVLFRNSAIICLEKKEAGRWAVDWILKPEML